MNKFQFHVKGWAPKLALRTRLKVTRGYPVESNKQYRLVKPVAVGRFVDVRTFTVDAVHHRSKLKYKYLLEVLRLDFVPCLSIL